MKFPWLCLLLMLCFSQGLRATEPQQSVSSTSLVVLAAPQLRDYGENFDIALDYVSSLAKLLKQRHQVVVLASGEAWNQLSRQLSPSELVYLVLDSSEISYLAPVGRHDLMQFRTPLRSDIHQYHRNIRAQHQLRRYSRQRGLHTQIVELAFAAAQWQENQAGVGIVSERFVTENHLNEQSALQILTQLLGVEQVAMITPERELPLDSTLTWLGPKHLLINRYPTAFRSRLLEQLEQLDPSIQLLEVGEGVEVNSTSMCDRYSGALVVDQVVYLPNFYGQEDVTIATELERHIGMQVVVVDSGKACEIGLSPSRLAWVIPPQAAAFYQPM